MTFSLRVKRLSFSTTLVVTKIRVIQGFSLAVQAFTRIQSMHMYGYVGAVMAIVMTTVRLIKINRGGIVERSNEELTDGILKAGWGRG